MKLYLKPICEDTWLLVHTNFSTVLFSSVLFSPVLLRNVSNYKSIQLSVYSNRVIFMMHIVELKSPKDASYAI